MMKIQSLVASLVALICLVGCQSTAEQKSTSTVKVSNHSQQFTSAYGFNRQLSMDLNSGNRKAINRYLSQQAVRQKFARIATAEEMKKYSKDYHAVEFQNVLLTALREYSELGNWTYLYSEDLSDDVFISHYRLELASEEVMYLDFTVERNLYQISDIKSASLAMSNVDFLFQLNQFLTKKDKSEQEKAKEKRLTEFSTAVETNNAENVLAQYQSMTEAQQNDPLLQEFLIRVYSIKPELQTEEMTVFLFQLLGSKPEYALAFEGFLVNAERFDEAIQSITVQPDYVAKDARMLAEIAAISLHKGDIEQAMIYSREAVMADPAEIMPLMMLLQVSLVSDNTDLSLQILNVFKSRFDVLIDASILSELEQGERFSQSEVYRVWKSIQG